MNTNQEDWHVPQITATDLAREQYYEELLENSRKRLTMLRTRSTPSAGQRATMEILLEETVAVQVKRELKRLRNRSFIL